MDRTINSFIQRNQKATEILGRVREEGLTSPNAQQLFYDSKSFLLDLFEDENRHLHPNILKKIKHDHFLSRTVHFFFNEAEHCEDVAHNFFDKYPRPSRGIHYSEDFGVVLAALLQRVRLEGHAIYGIYQEQLGQTIAEDYRKTA